MTYEQFWHSLTILYDAGEAKAIARMVLDVAFGMSMAEILCGKVTQLSADECQKLQKIQERLLKGDPVQYVLGCTDFCGRTFHVEPGVLIPRPETEELCRWIVENEELRMEDEGLRTKNGEPRAESGVAASEGKQQALRILDIGTGSGCIAITLSLDIPNSRVSAWDISDDALRIAQENARQLGTDISFMHNDALQRVAPSCQNALPAQDIIVSNPPYIYNKEKENMQLHVLGYEPHQALFAPDDDPMLFYRAISDYACSALSRGGSLYFELNPLLADDVALYLQSLGFCHVTIRNDQFGKKRFIKADKK